MQFSEYKQMSLSKLFNYLLFGLFVIAPFFGYLTRTVLNTYFTYLMVLACLFALYILFLDKSSFKLQGSFLFLAMFFLYTTFSDLLIVEASFNMSYVYRNLILGSLLIIFIIENTHISKRFFDIVFYLNHGIMFIAFVVIIIQQFHDPLFFVNPEFHEIIESRSYSNVRLPSIYSWMGSTNAVGLCFIPILGLTIAHHLKHNLRGVFYLYCIGIIVAFLSKSRFIMLNYILLFTLIPIYRGFNIVTGLKYTAYLLIFLFSIYSVSKLIGLDTDRIINERVLEKNKGGMVEGSAGTRILAFKIFQKLYFNNPIFGKGKFHSFGPEGSRDFELTNLLRGRSSQIHVGYLSLFYYYGIAGGTIFLLFLYVFTRESYAKSKKTKTWGPYFTIIQYLLINVTGVVLHLFFMGMVVSLIYQKYYSQEDQ